MNLKEMMAGSDEMLLRSLCAAYGTAKERELDINDPAHAAILMTGALRFAVAIAQAHGGDAEWFAGKARAMFDKTPIAISNAEDPGVRRWIETFRQTWGQQIPSAFMQTVDQPLH